MKYVVIRNEEGEYLTMVDGQIVFSRSPRGAFVYEMVRDRVVEQIAAVKVLLGCAWTAVPYESTLSGESAS